VYIARVEKFVHFKKLQIALEDIEQLQAADREAELRPMIGNVAHDLKTPCCPQSPQRLRLLETL